MLLATLFSLGLGYLARWRSRYRELRQVVSVESALTAPLAPEWLKPKILVRSEGVVSAAHLRSNLLLSREFTIALFSKLGVLCLFITCLWLVLEVPLPLYFKVALGSLALLFFGVLSYSFSGFKLTETARSPLFIWLPSLVGFWLVIYLTQQSIFPIWFALITLAVVTLGLILKVQFSTAAYLVPAILSLALYTPWLLDLSPTLGTALYLFFVFGLGTASLMFRYSAGTALFLVLALFAYGLTLHWWPSNNLTPSVISVIALTHFALLLGLTRQLIVVAKWLSLPSLAVLVWVLGQFNFLTLTTGAVMWGWLPAFGLLTGLVLYALNHSSNLKPAYILILSGVVFMLLFTEHFFSGFEYIIVSLLQVTLALTVVTYLGLPNRIVLPVAILFAWPMLATLPAVFAPEWQAGFWHLPGLTLYILLFCLLWLGGWFLHRQINFSFPWQNILAAVFGFLALVIFYLVVALVVTHLFRAPDAFVMLYVTGTLITLSAVYYCLKRNLPASITVLMASTWLVPALLSWSSFELHWWHSQSDSLHQFGVAWVWATGILITLLLASASRVVFSAGLTKAVAVGCFLSLLYSLQYLYVGVAYYLNGASHQPIYTLLVTALLLGLGSLLQRLNFSTVWLTVGWAFLALPIALVLPQTFLTNGWESGALANEALALLGLILLLAWLINWQTKHFPTAQGFNSPVGAWRYLFLGTLLVLVVGYVWSLLHSVLPVEVAKVTAFIILGGVGFYCFLRGATPRYYFWRGVGALLIGILVLRFFTFEIFSLELVWRSAIALILAGLFLFGAWYEKRRSTSTLPTTYLPNVVD